MYNKNIPANTQLPSTRKLVRSTILAACTAAALLVTVVMPAEYAIDPTGFGQLTGLQQMGEIRVSLAEEAAQDAQQAAVSTPAPVAVVAAASAAEPAAAPQVVAEPAATNTRKDEMTFTLAPNQAAEIKAALKKGQKVSYEWKSTGKLNFDNHGDSSALNIKYHGYSKGVGQERDAGEIEAAFDGKHGWFWRNRTKETVTVTLATNGEYTDLTRMD